MRNWRRILSKTGLVFRTVPNSVLATVQDRHHILAEQVTGRFTKNEQVFGGGPRRGCVLAKGEGGPIIADPDNCANDIIG